MNGEYVIIVSDNDVLFESDGRVFFKRIGKYLSIITHGMKKATITGDDSVIEMLFPSFSFSFPAKNGRYFISIAYA